MKKDSEQETEYVVYYRVSTKRQGDSGLGLDAQRSIVSHYHSDKRIISEFTDVASGKSTAKRPELEKAIQLCVKRGAWLIVAKHDRLSRKLEDALSIYDRLNERLILCDIPNPDRFTLSIFFAIAEREREIISIRTKDALREKKKQGAKLGRQDFPPEHRAKGNAAKSEYARMNKNNVHASHVIKQQIDKGRTLREVAEYLNTRKDEKGQRLYVTRTGKDFRPTTVKRLYERA